MTGSSDATHVTSMRPLSLDTSATVSGSGAPRCIIRTFSLAHPILINFSCIDSDTAIAHHDAPTTSSTDFLQASSTSALLMSGPWAVTTSGTPASAAAAMGKPIASHRKWA